MTECTLPAGCTAQEWAMAMAADLLFCAPGTVAQEIAIHRFAEAVRAAFIADLKPAIAKVGATP